MVDAALYEELQKLCQRSFPERYEQRITQVRSVSGGRHPSVSLSLAWREGRRPRVERLLVRGYADPYTLWSVGDGRKAHREWVVMRWLYAQGHAIPPLYASGTADGESYLLMAHPSGSEQPPDAETYVDALAEELARLHRLEPPASVREVLPQVDAPDECARLKRMAQECDDSAIGEALYELCAIEVEALPLCVLHGDPRSHNVLCDAQGVTALLGWENAALGDPRWDVGHATSGLRAGDAAPVDRFCARYQEQAGMALPDLTYWETLAAVQDWTLVEWVREHDTSGGAEGMLAQRDEVREGAWRAMTRLRYERRELAAVEEGPQPDGT